MQAQSRNIILDLLKGLAIIAIILYHLGVADGGYLGVDIFFVISGFLAAKGLIAKLETQGETYFGFLSKRLARLWPGLILISAIAIGVGWLTMIPLHFKVNCESVAATTFFVNNIVQCVISSDYWLETNDYKPLIHTWYIGELMQFYLVLPLIFLAAKRFTVNWLKTSFIALTLFSLASATLFLSPAMDMAQNFYLLPSRFFELGTGSLLAIALFIPRDKAGKLLPVIFCGLLAVTATIFIFNNFDTMRLRLLAVVAISAAMVAASHFITPGTTFRKWLSPITFMGVASYSLYLVHQLIFAFYRYIVNDHFSTWEYLGLTAAALIAGFIMYFTFEKPLSSYVARGKKQRRVINATCLAGAILLSAIGTYYYRNKGVVRDVPELELYAGEAWTTPEEYNCSAFAYDHFDDNGKPCILVIGDSFGRDWVNVLVESGVGSEMNIAYRATVDSKMLDLIHRADNIFVANNGSIFDSYRELVPLLISKEFYRVGIKGSDTWIGNIYNHRSNDYFSQTFDIPQWVIALDKKERGMFGDHYIDMLTPAMADDGIHLRAFTDERLLISQHTMHFTPAGARFYAGKLNVWQYLK